MLAAIATTLKPLSSYADKQPPSLGCAYPIASSPWRWLGLLLLAGVLAQSGMIDSLPLNWQQLGLSLALSLYLVCLLPFCPQAWLRHALVILILATGLLLLAWFENIYLLVTCLFIGLNGLLALSWWRSDVTSLDGRYLINLARQYSAALLILGFMLLWVFVSFYTVILEQTDKHLLGLLSACFISFLHWCAVLAALRSAPKFKCRYSLLINLLLWSGLSILWVLASPLLLAFWLALVTLLFLWLLLLSAERFMMPYSSTLFSQWTRLWLLGAVVASLWLLDPQQNEQLLALTAVFSAVFASLASLGRLWHGAASLSITVLIHVLWLPWVAELPWFFWALQDALLWSFFKISPNSKNQQQAWRRYFVLLQLPVVAQLSWGLGFVSAVYADLALPIGAVFAAFISAYLFTRQTVTSLGIYHKIIWATLALLLGRFYLLAWALPSLADTVVLLLLAALLSIWQRQFAENSTNHRHLYGLILAVVGLSCLSLLGQMQPLESSLSLFASASLLLFLPQRRPLSLYFSMLLLNLAVYIWLPNWVTKTHLLQLYLMPAAITLLLFVQLQQDLLSNARTHQLRLLALATLYSAAMVDFFQQPGILVFSLALGLSLSGIMIGLVFRIRAFLYTGLVFLLLFIASQLLQFYPEDSLYKGLILMGLGILITVSTFIFQLKRLILLKQWQRWQNHLKYWQ